MDGIRLFTSQEMCQNKEYRLLRLELLQRLPMFKACYVFPHTYGAKQNRGPEDVPRISGTTVPLVGPLALGKGIYVEVAINECTPIAGRFISWKIHLWMITGDYPHGLGNLHISKKEIPKQRPNKKFFLDVTSMMFLEIVPVPSGNLT